MTQGQSVDNSPGAREDLLQRTVESLSSIVRQLHRGALLQEFGLSPSQARLAFVIARSGEVGISVTELARMTHVTPGAITQFADALMVKGLLSREEDPDDRRVVRLKLTPAARSHMRAFRHRFLASMAGPFEVLSTDELRQLNDLLAKVSSSTVQHHERSC
jgi:DNA-binding MarR family transcriptional regulator